jgi:hypothetical protein
MKNLKRQNHFLPVCYQKGFTDSSGKIWVKFANKSAPEHRNPHSVGKRSSLYIVKRNGIADDKVEDFFNTVVETPFAPLSQRIREERNRLSSVSDEELGALCAFVASQLVRTLAHKRCLEEQTGGPIDANTFVVTLAKQSLAILETWAKTSPQIEFHTSLPHVGEQFIAGDSPVVVIQMNDNPIWVPNSDAKLAITDLLQFLSNPNYHFWVSLSPYVCVSIAGRGGGLARLPPQTVDPQFVRFLNGRVREQSGIFLLARDKAFLA